MASTHMTARMCIWHECECDNIETTSYTYMHIPKHNQQFARKHRHTHTVAIFDEYGPRIASAASRATLFCGPIKHKWQITVNARARSRRCSCKGLNVVALYKCNDARVMKTREAFLLCVWLGVLCKADFRVEFKCKQIAIDIAKPNIQIKRHT